MHDDLEADDLWQNIVMWQRTGQQGYYDLAAAWADYYKNRYRSDYQDDLINHFGCHTFGWGLVEWARVTGDNSYLAAANQIADDLQTQWYGSYAESVKQGFYGMRGPGRQLKLAVALGRRSELPERDCGRVLPQLSGLHLCAVFALQAANDAQPCDQRDRYHRSA